MPYVTMAAEDAAQLLSDAINSRDKDEATKHLDRLLDLKLPVCVKLNPDAYSRDSIRYAVRPVPSHGKR